MVELIVLNVVTVVTLFSNTAASLICILNLLFSISSFFSLFVIINTATPRPTTSTPKTTTPTISGTKDAVSLFLFFVASLDFAKDVVSLDGVVVPATPEPPLLVPPLLVPPLLVPPLLVPPLLVPSLLVPSLLVPSFDEAAGSVAGALLSLPGTISYDAELDVSTLPELRRRRRFGILYSTLLSTD